MNREGTLETARLALENQLCPDQLYDDSNLLDLSEPHLLHLQSWMAFFLPCRAAVKTQRDNICKVLSTPLTQSRHTYAVILIIKSNRQEAPEVSIDLL